jgi:translation elongation factor EF-1alpha
VLELQKKLQRFEEQEVLELMHHLSIVICGHVDSDKSTTTGRLIFELSGLPEHELEKLKTEAERLDKDSFALAFCTDRQNEERERGATVTCTTKEFYTKKWHYTISDAGMDVQSRYSAYVKALNEPRPWEVQ